MLLYIMLDYLMLFTALLNAVCLYACLFIYFAIGICAWFGHVLALLMVFLNNALMCINKSKIN